MEGYDADSGKFPSVRYQGLSLVGFRRLQEGGNAARSLLVRMLSWTCTEEHKVTLLPASTERLLVSPALLFTKGQKQKGNSNATERKSKAVNIGGVNYDMEMDRGTMMLTSSVSLPKDSVDTRTRHMYPRRRG